MLKVVTCFKWVIDEADIKADRASRKLLLDRVSHKISAYDRNAIEEAMRLQEEHGASVVALTVAPPSAKGCLKDALSRGPDEAVFVNDPSFDDLDPCQTSALIATAIGLVGGSDLVICGEGSSDLYAQQVGPALAERLGVSCATYVNKLTYVENEDSIVVERKLEDEVEVLRVPLPAVISVLPDINTPRIPSLKQVLGAAKKPVTDVGLDRVGEPVAPCLETLDVSAAVMDRKRLRFGQGADDVRSVIGALLKEGVIA